MKKVGHTSEFLFGRHLLINLKNNNLLKKLLKQANKKCKKFFFSFTYLHLCTKTLDDMIYSSWDIECERLKLVIMVHFLAFYLPKNPKLEFWKNEAKNAGDIINLHVPKTTII